MLEETLSKGLRADHHGGDGRRRALGDDDSRRRLVRAILASARERLASPPATRAASAPVSYTHLTLPTIYSV